MAKKIVEYDVWCEKCKHVDKAEHEDPCHDCLNEPFNDDSHKPVNWEKIKSQT